MARDADVLPPGAGPIAELPRFVIPGDMDIGTDEVHTIKIRETPKPGDPVGAGGRSNCLGDTPDTA